MKKLALLLVTLPLIAGCVHKMRTWDGYLKSQALMQVAVGMTKEQVIMQLGAPDIVRGSMKNDQGQVVEVWEYMVIRREISPLPYSEVYWLSFHDNQLAQWCKAGDWQTAHHEMKEIRFS